MRRKVTSEAVEEMKSRVEEALCFNIRAPRWTDTTESTCAQDAVEEGRFESIGGKPG